MSRRNGHSAITILIATAVAVAFSFLYHVLYLIGPFDQFSLDSSSAVGCVLSTVQALVA